MMLVCRSSVDRLRFLTHVLAIEISNLVYSFFELLGLDLGSTKFVLATVHVGVASSDVRGWVQNPLTVGKGHPQQILAAVSPLREGPWVTICLRSSKDHSPTFKPPGIPSRVDATSSLTARDSCPWPYGKLRSDRAAAFSARAIREVGLTQQIWSQWPNHGLADPALLW